MAYRANPFLERMSERTSDQEFVRLFSPKILEKLPDDAFDGAVHVFRSPPGGGKTTLLRALTPTALRAFWSCRKMPEMNESYQKLAARDLVLEGEGPQLLGVHLSCASGYADLPPGASMIPEGTFRALLDCRVVLRTLRSLILLLGNQPEDRLRGINLQYGEQLSDLKEIPLAENIEDLISWAEKREQSVYRHLDSFDEGNESPETPLHVRLESVIWLQHVSFVYNDKIIAPKRLLMIDDLHKLRRKQRDSLVEELIELRPAIPVWLAERRIALSGKELLSQGAREGRDMREYDLESFWTSPRGQFQFNTFAQNILDRRLSAQDMIPRTTFEQYLRSEIREEELRTEVLEIQGSFLKETKRYRSDPQYAEWFEKADLYLKEQTYDSMIGILSTKILIARNEGKKQMSLMLGPLPVEELEERENSNVKGAAEIFANYEVKVPYYFGMDRLCTMASNNVEELLNLAASLYEGLQAKQVLRRRQELILSPHEQERLLRDAAKKKRDFIPKSHREGTRAQRLIDAIGAFCVSKTFTDNAPYAPGVTGIRLSFQELEKLERIHPVLGDKLFLLKSVLSECVAENLFVTKPSSPTTSREGGTVLYLNRTLCAYYGLPLQMGGWQDVKAEDLYSWMYSTKKPVVKQTLLEAN